MAQRKSGTLKRAISLESVAGGVFVNIAGAMFIVLGLTAASAAGLTPLVFLCAGVVFMLTAHTFVEGIAMLPEAGGSSSFARRAFNDFWSFVAGWVVLLDYMITVGIAAYFAVHYVSVIPGLEGLDRRPYDTITAIGLVAVLAVINIRGTGIRTRLATGVAVSAIALLCLVITMGIYTIVTGELTVSDSVDREVLPGWSALIFALPLGMIGFTGIENIANQSEELKQQAAALTRPIMLSIFVAVALLIGMSIVGLTIHAPHLASGEIISFLGESPSNGGYQTRPVIGILDGIGLPDAIADVARITVAVVASIVLFLLANTGIAGMSRLVWSMSRNRQFPSAFSRIDREAHVPVLAVAIFSVLVAVMLLVSSAYDEPSIVLGQLYAFGAMLGFMLAHAAIIWLRFTAADADRPYLAPGNFRFRGISIPFSAVAGFVLSLLMWAAVLVTHDAARTMGIVWLIAGGVSYAAYRFLHGLPLIRVAPRRTALPIPVDIPEYRSVLLAIRPPKVGVTEKVMQVDSKSVTGLDGELVSLATKLLGSPDDDRGVTVQVPGSIVAASVPITVCMIHEVPLRDPIDVDLGRAVGATERRVEVIQRKAEKLGVVIDMVTGRARAAGRAICQEAENRGCDAIILASPEKQRPADATFGKTVEYVLRHAKCDVIVLRVPKQVHS